VAGCYAAFLHHDSGQWLCYKRPDSKETKVSEPANSCDREDN
jgi:hypothetical protein